MHLSDVLPHIAILNRHIGLPEMAFTFQETIGGETTTTTMLIDALLVATGRRPNVTGKFVEH